MAVLCIYFQVFVGFDTSERSKGDRKIRKQQVVSSSFGIFSLFFKAGKLVTNSSLHGPSVDVERGVVDREDKALERSRVKILARSI